MKFFSMILTLILMVTAIQAQPDPTYYHNTDQIRDMIFDLQTQYPERVKIDSIGHSQQDSVAIYMVKISNDAYTDYDRPAVLFIGQIHAEEIQGIEVVLKAMEELASRPEREFRDRRNFLEMYFIPTLNPEGNNVVHGIGNPGDMIYGYDESYRKNKRDNLGDGVFRYWLSPHGGGDTSGVDLNRNFDINWFHGDSLFTARNHYELWDYYRGPYPGSDSELEAFTRVVEEIRPVISLTYHTSRTGNFSEKVMYPWDWNLNSLIDGKASPDIDVISDIADNYAHHLERYNAGGFYSPSPSGGRNGKMHDWMYAEGGWINMQSELSSIQPDSAVAAEIRNNVIDGLYYLIDRAGPLEAAPGNKGQLKVIVTDPTGAPLVAEVYLPERHNGYLKPRFTDPVFGVFRQQLLQGTYRVIVRAWGYEISDEDVFVGDGAFESPHEVVLQPKPKHLFGIQMKDGDDLIPGTMIVHREFGVDTLHLDDGQFFAYWPEGSYSIETWADADGYLPWRYDFSLSNDFTFFADMLPENVIQIDDFESGVPANWLADEGFQWGLSAREKHSGTFSLESVPYDFIPFNGSGVVTATYDVPQGAESVVIKGWDAFELEPDYDFCEVDINYGGGWENFATLNGFSRWHRFFYIVPAELINGDQVQIRWTITTDEFDNDRGLFLDDVALVTSDQVVSVDEIETIPSRWALHDIYPNPFNPSARIDYEIAISSQVNLAIYDILGRKVMDLVNEYSASGLHRVTFDMSAYSSGIYFVRLDAGDFHSSKKILLVK